MAWFCVRQITLAGAAVKAPHCGRGVRKERKNEMYAVVETGGKQYRVSPGDWLEVEKLAGEVGDAITLDRVLLVHDGAEVHIGQPLVNGAAVKATIKAQHKGPKVIVFKYRPKQRYRRKRGHRQLLTRLYIDSIETA
jgi:large subunit ribosomal protein L21